MVNNENTEIKIIEAAKEVFVHKGFEGARMQEIADTAGINKALLHYYFRSKSKLFDKVFHSVFADLVAKLYKTVGISNTIEEFIESFVSLYFEELKSKQYIPQFVLHEINRDHSVIVNLIKSRGLDKQKIIALIHKESQREDIKQFDPVQVMVTVISMTIFPFVASGILVGFIFDGDQASFDNFIDERKQHILEFVNAAIFKK